MARDGGICSHHLPYFEVRLALNNAKRHPTILVGPTVSPATNSYNRFVAAALAASDDCIKILGLDGTLQFMTEGGQRVMEVDDFEALRGCPWPDFWQDQGNADAIAAVADAREGRTARFLGYANTAKGNRRFWDVKVSPIFAEDGTVEAILSVSRDITAQKQSEEEQILLRAELSHRIKNILALVQAIASQTLREDDDIAVSKAEFLARLAALGKTHDLLVRTNHAATTLRAVAETAADERPSGRIVVSGPEVELSARSGLALTLALHELATNATKYGALSNAEGTVQIQWTVGTVDGRERMDLSWIEQDGPEVAEPTRKGFGSRMIERALAHYVDGDAELSFPPTGLTFRISAPLEALRAN